jgi:hypothetical protein
VKGPEALEGIFFENTTNGKLWIWAKPEEDSHILHRYLVAVDVGGRSKKADWSVIRVFDRAPMIC